MRMHGGQEGPTVCEDVERRRAGSLTAFGGNQHRGEANTSEGQENREGQGWREESGNHLVGAWFDC